MERFDTVVIGSGPAGIGAITYLKRAKVNFLWLEKGAPGGKLINIHEIANCPGFAPQSGFSLSQALMSPLDVSPSYGDVSSIRKEGEDFIVSYNDKEVASKTVLLATGLSNSPKISGEKDYIGKGVSYCATCDGPFFRNQAIALEGEGEKAFEEALYLSSLAKELHVFYPDSSFFMDDASLREKSNVVMHPNSKITKINGDSEGKYVESIAYKEKENEKTMQIAAVFPLSGESTDLFFMRYLSPKTEKGFLLVDDSMETSVPGLFAAGDIVRKRLRQVVTALGDGAVASSGIITYLRKRK